MFGNRCEDGRIFTIGHLFIPPLFTKIISPALWSQRRPWIFPVYMSRPVYIHHEPFKDTCEHVLHPCRTNAFCPSIIYSRQKMEGRILYSMRQKGQYPKLNMSHILQKHFFEPLKSTIMVNFASWRHAWSKEESRKNTSNFWLWLYRPSKQQLTKRCVVELW